jgi:dsDNA-specific endonuclease/ATPase MutS2
VPSVVDEYLREAAARGLGEVRLIHGRGIGVRRAVVQSLLAAHPLVEHYFDAPPSRGGWGATVAVLRSAPRR